MHSDIETSPNTHTYKPKRWTLALNIFSMLFIWIIMGIPLVALALMVTSVIRNQSEFISVATAFGCLLSPVIILMGLNILMATISTALSFFSYIKITPDGIEQKYAISKHIRSKWSDVDRLGKLFLFTDVIFLDSYDVVGTSLSLKSPFRFLRPKQGFISLTGFEGWPDGQLANDLKEYVPKLFENQPISQAVQTENNREGQPAEAPYMSQEVRLLAAISHAAVLFTNIGCIISIVIYLTQKKKSSYLGFQALQAFIWQITMFVFTMVTSSCMVGSILIPVLLTSASRSERLIGFSGGGIFMATIIIVFLMILANLAFMIFGIIGAVRTYQGKDFRYVFIGNRIEKSKNATLTNSA